MVGQGALRECLRDPNVECVVSVVRSPGKIQNEKLREIAHQDFLNFAPIENELTGVDACLYCMGIASSGMSEDAYARVTYGFTIAAAQTLLHLNPGMSFVFISAVGADSSERGRSMWARVKGKTENALLAMPFGAVYVLRPALIQPLDGITSKTRNYRLIYGMTGPLLTLARRFWPKYVTTTRELGQAMLAAAKRKTGKQVIESQEIRGVLASRS